MRVYPQSLAQPFPDRADRLVPSIVRHVPSLARFMGTGKHAVYNSGRASGESGGIGIRAGFRCQWGNPWGFESPLSHHPAGLSAGRGSPAPTGAEAARPRLLTLPANEGSIAPTLRNGTPFRGWPGKDRYR